jgi:hypothetical protein
MVNIMQILCRDLEPCAISLETVQQQQLLLLPCNGYSTFRHSQSDMLCQEK